MKFKVQDVDIATGGTLVAILHWKDAHMLDLHHGDRLRITRGSKSTVAVLDIAESAKLVKRGRIGLMEEVLAKLSAKQGSNVSISIEEKPKSIAMIKKKLNGKKLSPEEMDTIIRDIVDNKLTSIEITYFVAAGYTRGLDMDETVALTKAMISTGKRLKMDCYPVVDKHCIGGVAGNRTTMVVVPILVAAGYCVPKTSSRSITSPAGTADTMEVLCDVNHDMDSIKRIVDKVGGCMVWGGAVNLAPADDKIITVEHPLSVDAEGQLLASILAKKGSVSATHVLIDIPVGRGAKVERMDKAKHLKKQFMRIGRKIGMKIHVVMTDGAEPIGNGIGPALEARDVLWLLQGHANAPQDLKRKALLMASEIMRKYPLRKGMKGKCYHVAKDILESGRAWEAMDRIINAQGARVTDPRRICIGKNTFDVKAPKAGKIVHIDNVGVSRVAKVAGAPFDKGAGIYLKHHVGDRVVKGEVLFTVYSENAQKLEYAKDVLSRVVVFELE
ncbi:AMP phosphorylase [Candidatus Woesearchaeota archaeon]|nr:AMP phosphorylase [Candidatus Woesearchaeota archaeon]